MYRIILSICLMVFTVPVAFAFTTWENSPMNFNNSPMNFQNSPMNFRNSPMNFQNSPNNPNANIIYDSNGNAKGYAVQKSNGSGVNIYDFQGNHSGYYNY